MRRIGPPTLDEIRKLIEYPDRRIKAVVYTMASSGIRVGAWNYLQWKHIQPVKKDGKIVAAKIIVYSGEDEEYFSFITLEAYRELEKWIEYRIQSGEGITDNSWLMRNIWNTKKGYTRGLVCAPLKLKSEGVKRLIDDALWTQGIRKKLGEGKKRHEFQVDHGFRKWFKTRCEMSGMRPINIEVLMNHSTGISDSYYRATENELLEDYLNEAKDYLTINSEQKLRQQVQELTDTNYAESHLIREEFFDKKKELDILKQQDFINTDAIKNLSDQLTSVMEEIKNLKEKRTVNRI
jgi:integrase